MFIRLPRVALCLMCTFVSAATAAEPPGVAVVELFTSEGCSSCPPADLVMGRLVEQQAKTPGEVYCLTFHVDYWDDLGWPDRFADRRFTERQRQYGAAFKSERIYTPQMVVNGQTEFVGSNRKLALQAIAEAQTTAAEVEITLSTQPVAGGKLKVHFDLSESVAGSVVQIAIVETGLETKVKRGENAGSTLKHANVVRGWESVDPQIAKTGEVVISLPRGIDWAQTRVIAFVQEQPSMRVLGACQTDFIDVIQPAGR